MDKERFFKCECGCGGLLAEYHPDWGLELAHLQRIAARDSWTWRLRHAWHALRGNVYADMVILNKESITDLTNYLMDCQCQDETDS